MMDLGVNRMFNLSEFLFFRISYICSSTQRDSTKYSHWTFVILPSLANLYIDVVHIADIFGPFSMSNSTPARVTMGS